MLKLSSNEKLEQAYVVVGDRQAATEEIKVFLADRFGLDFVSPHQPDFWCQTFDTFGIDQARAIKDIQSRRPLTAAGRVFIISVGLITIEAQNALLKMLEEPLAENYFFILAKTRGIFLPTLLSRCRVITTDQNIDEEMNQLSQRFLKGDINTRLKIAEEIAKKHSDGQKMILPDFINNLTLAFKQSVDLTRLSKEELVALEELHKIAIKVNDRSSSSKILISHLALIIPTR